MKQSARTWRSAIDLYQRSLALHEQIGNVQGKTATLVMMAQLVAGQGDLTQAIAMTRESLAILQLAVPLEIYRSFFQKQFVQESIEDNQIPLIIYNSDQEEIVQWIS
jgi:hypothetical protein